MPAAGLCPPGSGLIVDLPSTAKATIEFKLDDQGVITGAEERWERGRHTIPRQTTGAAAHYTVVDWSATDSGGRAAPRG